MFQDSCYSSQRRHIVPFFMACGCPAKATSRLTMDYDFVSIRLVSFERDPTIMLFNYRAFMPGTACFVRNALLCRRHQYHRLSRASIPISPQTKASFSLKGPASSLKTIKLLTLSLSPEATAMLLQRENHPFLPPLSQQQSPVMAASSSA